MLLATPYMHFDKVLPKSGPPRVISEIKKQEVGLYKEPSRSRLSGDLLVKCANEEQWWPRRVMIRGGQLMVGCAHNDVKSGSLRIPLRHLSLSAGSLPNSISLVRGQNVILTMQAASERAFDLWVKSIAIELIRQTPLEAVKYLDILTIADCWNRKESEQERDWNFNCMKENNPKHCNTCNLAYHSLIQGKTDLKCSAPPMPADQPAANAVEKVAVRARSRSCTPRPKPYDETYDINTTCNTAFNSRHRDVNSNYIKRPEVNREVETSDNSVDVLLKKCQNSESYVPVKDKLMLFETLCRLGRKVRSTEDVSLKTDVGTKRARSLYDLHSFGNTGVREICKYFENKQEDAKSFSAVKPDKRLIYSDSNLNNLQRVKCLRNLQNVSFA